MIIDLTRHSVKRGMERLNLTPHALFRTAQKAFEVGVHHDLAKGKLGSWARDQIRTSQAGSHIRILGHQAFVFYDQFLLTVLLVPKWAMPKVRIHAMANRPEEDFEQEDLDDENPHDIR